MTDEADRPPLVTVAEAALMTGLTEEGVRSRIRRGQLRAVRGNDKRLLVEVPVGFDQSLTDHEQAVTDVLTGRDLFIATLEDELTDLRTKLNSANLKAERAEAQLEAVRTGYERELTAVRTAAEAQEKVRAELVDELKKLLDRSERPWWRRIIG